MSAHSSWRCCTAGSMRCPRAERPFVRPRRAELLTVRLRRSARALAIVDVCDYDPGCGHGALSPCLQAVRRSRAGRHLLVLGLRPGSAGPGRLGLEVETAPAKIFRYILVSSSSRGCLSAAADVALSPCLQAVRRSRAGRHLLVLGLRPGSAGPGRLGLEVETAPAKIFRYILVSSSSRGCLSAAADVAATACPRTGRSPLAPPYRVGGGLRGLPWQSPVPVRAGGALRSHPRDAAPLT